MEQEDETAKRLAERDQLIAVLKVLVETSWGLDDVTFAFDDARTEAQALLHKLGAIA